MKVRNNSDTPLVVADVVVKPGEVREVRGDVWWRMKAERKEFAEACEQGVYEALTHLLPGDGDPECKLCLGRGFVTANDTTVGRRCSCVRKRDVIANVNKIWPMYRLIEAPKLGKGERSPLMDYTDRNLYVTSPEDTFKAHLRYTAIRQGTAWNARVRGDNDLLRAWLFTAKAKGVEIYDVDVADSAISEDPSIEDLALPPDLLIIVMGVKRSRNVASPETLMEALKLREFRSKPTWIVDQPNYLVTDDTHLFYDHEISTILNSWTRVELSATAPTVAHDPSDILAAPPAQATPKPRGRRLVPTLSDTVGAKKGKTTTEDIVETEKAKRGPRKGKGK